VLKHLLQVHSLTGVKYQTFFDEIFGYLVDANSIWELKGTQLNFLVGLLNFYRLKRWSAVEHREENNTDWPVVNFVAVAICIFEDFWCQIIRSTTNSFFTLPVVVNLRCKAEISDFELHPFCKKEITQLKISVDDSLAVYVLDSFN